MKGKANQRHALEVLWSIGKSTSAAELSRVAQVPVSAVRALVKKGYATYMEIPAPAPELPSIDALAIEYPVETLPNVNCLGISGGTRLSRLSKLVSSLKGDIDRGGQVLILVPELAHLHLVAAAIASELPLFILSGELNDEQRQRVWRELPEQPAVLVSTYLGLLVDLPSLARIVVLEEGSGSYKLDFGCRAFVPRLAAQLAGMREIPIVYSDCFLSPEIELNLDEMLAKNAPDIGQTHRIEEAKLNVFSFFSCKIEWRS